MELKWNESDLALVVVAVLALPEPARPLGIDGGVARGVGVGGLELRPRGALVLGGSRRHPEVRLEHGVKVPPRFARGRALVRSRSDGQYIACSCSGQRCGAVGQGGGAEGRAGLPISTVPNEGRFMRKE